MLCRSPHYTTVHYELAVSGEKNSCWGIRPRQRIRATRLLELLMRLFANPQGLDGDGERIESGFCGQVRGIVSRIDAHRSATPPHLPTWSERDRQPYGVCGQNGPGRCSISVPKRTLRCYTVHAKEAVSMRQVPTYVFTTALACLTAGASFANTLRDKAIGLLVTELRSIGYSNISVNSRLNDGYVVEARKGNEALVLALDGITFRVVNIQIFVANGAATTGFFGTRATTLSPAGRTALDRYDGQLANTTATTTQVDVPKILNAAPTTAGTAGFSQSGSISATGDVAQIRRLETLGLLTPHVSETTTTKGAENTDNHSHSVEHTSGYSRQEVTAVIQIPGGGAFGQQIFSNPEGFRNSLNSGSVTLPPVAPPIIPPVVLPVITPTAPAVDRTQVIDGVVTAIESTLAQMPANGGPTLPANLREQLRTSTLPQP